MSFFDKIKLYLKLYKYIIESCRSQVTIMKIKINKSELDLIRSKLADISTRASAILIMHQCRQWTNPTLKWLRDFCTSKPLRDATSWLRANGVISTTGGYQAGVHSSKLVISECSEELILDDSFPEFNEITKILARKKNKEIKDIKKIQNIDGIRYDDVTAFNTKYEEIKLKIENNKKELKLFEENTKEFKIIKKELKKLDYQRQSIEDFKTNNIKIHTYKKFCCKRLFSSITNLPKELKSHIINDNGYFFGVDVKASQPRLIEKALLDLLNENNNHVTIADLWFYTKWILDVDSDLCSIYGIDEYKDSYENWLTKVKLEINQFNEITKNDLYMYVCDYFGYDETKRDTIKREFLWYMFDYNNKILGSYDFMKFMEATFPLLNTFIIGLKKAQKYSGLRKYSLSDKLSSIESDLILRTITKEFISTHPNVNIFTIHDSMAVNVEYLGDLINIIERVYKQNNINLKYVIEDFKNNKKYNNINNIINDNNNNIKNIKQYNNIEKDGREGGKRTDLCLHFSNDTKINDTKIREVKDHGSIAWMYRGTGDQQIKKSTKKYTKEQFIKLINAKFMSGEWK